jgi:pimeloyl-ACP methyl ester carboxylesterase
MHHLFKASILAIALPALLMSSAVSAENSSLTTAGAPSAVTQQKMTDSWKDVATRTISAGGIDFAYRELGKNNGGTPVVFMAHLAAVLDKSIEQMADDAITFIHAMGLKQVDIFGFSMGGMVAQEVVLKDPQLVRKMILAGTGPAGGEGISSVSGVTYYDMMRGFFTLQDPKQFLFFTRTPSGIKAGKAYLLRLNERSANRDTEITVKAFMAQLKALSAWGAKEPADLSKVYQPVLVANGDSDRMVPSVNTHDLARRLPHSELIIYPDAGHGGVFQNYADFVSKSLEFLAR